MTREQAINYLISRGLTQEQVGDVVRALTYKPRDCANCKHYVVTDTRTNWGSQGTTKIYGCERWECEYEPTTKNDSSELEKNSKKLEKDFGELDCISRADYENRLKADLKAILVELQLEIEENQIIAPQDTFYDKKLDGQFNRGIFKASDIIQQKINSLTEA